jgi:hypothetical protein
MATNISTRRAFLTTAGLAVSGAPWLAAMAGELDRSLAHQVEAAERPVAASIATLAALYGIPLVGMQARLNSEIIDPATRLAPFDAFYRYAELATPERAPFKAPNVDTLYATAWLDLRSGPVVLSAPPTGTRYWNAQVMDFTTDTIANVGQGRFGNAAGLFAFAGPDWTGDQPHGVEALVRSPTDYALILLRVLVDGPQDEAAAAAVQAGFTLARVGPAEPLPALLPLSSAAERFAALDAILSRDPIRSGEQALMDQFALLGLGPAKVPGHLSAAPGLLAEADKQATEAARLSGLTLGRVENGWRIIDRGIGAYGFDYLRRAAVWTGGPLANVPEESLYPSTVQDASGDPLDGRFAYVLRFPPGGLPPARAFWSLTVYHRDTGMLVANPIHRYAIGNRSPDLQYGPDGSLTIRISHNPPADDANWLPAPEGLFYLTLRLYRPDPAALDGAWKPPAVERVT